MDERPYPIEVICQSNLTFKAREMEIQLHEKYQFKRLGGEWFALDNEDVTTVKNILGQIGMGEDRNE